MKFRTLIALMVASASLLGLASCGGGRSARGTNVTVTGTGPSGTVTAGDSVVFSMTVANAGGDAATDLVITDGLRTANLVSIACKAQDGGVCPASLSASMNVPSLSAGASLVFTITGTVEAGANLPVVNTMTATIADDTNRVDNTFSVQVDASTAPGVGLGVTETGAATVAAGSSAQFVATVTNPGPGAVNNVAIEWAPTAAYDTSSTTVKCTSLGAATCPDTLGTSMSVPTLAAGRSLIFTFTVAVPEAARGTLTSTVSVTADGDSDTSNNTAVVTTVAADGRNGSYKAYAANGKLYDMTVDFDAKTYSMADSASSVTRSFTVGSDGTYTVSGASKFRSATDLLVGGHDFGSGNVPYVAARTFGTTVNELTGLYNLATRNVAADGTNPVTRPGTARASGNVLQVCELPTLVAVTQNCESAYLKSFVVSVDSDGVYTGVEVTTGETYTFRVAASGASRFLLSAMTMPDSTLQFRVGLPDSSALAGGSLFGPSSTGDWISMTLTSTTYSFVNTAGVGDDAALVRISNAGPFAMLSGTRRTDGKTVYVMQASPLAAVVDAATTVGGVMQLAVP